MRAGFQNIPSVNSKDMLEISCLQYFRNHPQVKIVSDWVIWYLLPIHADSGICEERDRASKTVIWILLSNSNDTKIH